MKQRIVSVWIAIFSATAVACICHLLAGEAGIPIQSQLGAELPLISKVFYPDSVLIYLYPIPLWIWALLHTVISRDDREQSLLLITLIFSFSVIFIAGFILALALPYIPGSTIAIP